MNKIIPIVTAIFVISLSGCSLFQPYDETEIDLGHLPATDAGVGNAGEALMAVSQITRSTDDAEERSGGFVALSNATIELTNFKGGDQIIGLRFQPELPEEAIISDAYIQFTSAGANSENTSLTIFGEAAANPSTFESVSKSLRARPLTTSSSAWAPTAWQASGDTGTEQRSSSVNIILQELKDKHGWVSGNHVVFYVKGSGLRVAASFDKQPTQAPALIINYTLPIPEPEYMYRGLNYDLLLKPVYDQGYRDGFLSTDEDGDGLPDSWEIAYGLDPLDPSDAEKMDSDQDLLTAGEEFLAATSPIDPDTDGDGLPDGYELYYGLNPTYSADALLDLDGDGYSNIDEYLAGTAPESSTDFPVIIPTSYTVQVDWTSPTKREDGSELVRDEISGFVVSYGKNVEDMNFVISVDDPSATNTQITLTEPGMYYFSIIAIDVNGVESRPSTIQQINVGQ